MKNIMKNIWIAFVMVVCISLHAETRITQQQTIIVNDNNNVKTVTVSPYDKALSYVPPAYVSPKVVHKKTITVKTYKTIKTKPVLVRSCPTISWRISSYNKPQPRPRPRYILKPQPRPRPRYILKPQPRPRGDYYGHR